MAFCSASTLCFAAICALISGALLAISFSTDNWQVIRVKRNELENSLSLSPEDELFQKFNSSPLFFTRTRGLFRECFLGEKRNAPNDGEVIELYMSPVETWCHNLNYYIPDEEGVTKDFSAENMTRIHMGRAMIALFIVAFFFMFVSFTTGIVGCWRTSPSNITSSGILMLMACLFAAGAMGLWHGVEHYEKNKINERSNIELFVRSWPKILIDNTEFKYDWSYIVAWVGVAMALCSSILFSLAAVCIKNDREREEAMNMQYLMPVYPQKQQTYGPGPGAYGYPAYPGPAAYYGSQYGLAYNQY
ncbi:hypothetical protein TCAL_02491 [Tigriopus californicus]|uniref:Claudin domain-containing protein 1 n=1 Tax=Tigriopus californicus TaxID=6832 RepID=A0A553NTI7_TIGCA|nr:uncharacterized protein LOC131890268 [Tigriopus californicus]TRY68742.1 hypothetical protein TCAL_02491 [Tigriopus californicus]|eukprot:TCALIF_02491-PA protein Name:"Protein of unknown function" AED:0.02 eAED:0.02 QI:359/1/1/1/0.8/0.83/6/325/303